MNEFMYVMRLCLFRMFLITLSYGRNTFIILMSYSFPVAEKTFTMLLFATIFDKKQKSVTIIRSHIKSSEKYLSR